jgi:hypothetical protein
MKLDTDIAASPCWPPDLNTIGTNLDREYLEALIPERDAAKFLSFAPRTLQNWRILGIGPKFVRHRARTVRYRRKDLIHWLEARLVSSTSEKSKAA